MNVNYFPLKPLNANQGVNPATGGNIGFFIEIFFSKLSTKAPSTSFSCSSCTRKVNAVEYLSDLARQSQLEWQNLRIYNKPFVCGSSCFLNTI